VNLLLSLVCLLLDVYWVVLIVRIFLSWVPRLPDPIAPLARAVYAVTDPVLNPVRGLLPSIQTGAMAIDLSPILVFLGIGLIRGAIC
jgi:YggT family protein